MAFRAWTTVKSVFTVLPLMALPLAGAALAQQNAVIAFLTDAQGKNVGKVTLVGTPNGLSGTIEVKRLPPGEHGMHVHMVGKCSGNGFADAGAHLNPQNKQHGLNSPMGAHGRLAGAQGRRRRACEAEFPREGHISGSAGHRRSRFRDPRERG